MYKIIKYGIVGVLLWGFTIPLWGENNPPCKYPPFLGKSAVIPPHIIFVMDYSGSMSWMPYPNDKRDGRSYNLTYHDVISFGGKQLTYAGQFKPRMYYRYNTKEGYKTSVPFKTSTKKITDSNIKLFFNLPVNKSFAIAIFQDLNDNNLLDTKGSMKIPVEPFGFSNNTIGILGPPRYNKMSFKVVSDTTLIINIITDTKGYLKRTK